MRTTRTTASITRMRGSLVARVAVGVIITAALLPASAAPTQFPRQFHPEVLEAFFKPGHHVQCIEDGRVCQVISPTGIGSIYIRNDG